MAAAGALFALEHNIEQLREDHANAQVLTRAIRQTDGLRLDPPEVQTNIIWFQVDPALGSANDVAARLKPHGVLVGVGGPETLRACTHLDVSRSMAERAAETIRSVVSQSPGSRSDLAASTGAARY
jgi:threonine aldolase